MTEASTGTGSPSRAALAAAPVWRAGLLAAVAATVANALLWVLLQPVLDVGLQIPASPGSSRLQELPLGPVVVTTLLTGVVGAAVLWLLSRRGATGVRLWTILAAVFGVLSGLVVFNVDVTLGRQLGLLLFHLLATAVMIGVVVRRLPAR